MSSQHTGRATTARSPTRAHTQAVPSRRESKKVRGAARGTALANHVLRPSPCAGLVVQSSMKRARCATAACAGCHSTTEQSMHRACRCMRRERTHARTHARWHAVHPTEHAHPDSLQQAGASTALQHPMHAARVLRIRDSSQTTCQAPGTQPKRSGHHGPSETGLLRPQPPGQATRNQCRHGHRQAQNAAVSSSSQPNACAARAPSGRCRLVFPWLCTQEAMLCTWLARRPAPTRLCRTQLPGSLAKNT